ncbi:uncharacterized protein LOC110988154 isoform X2 [Acanthaster planci]|uniref:Uncharacterized protein LOC110988154 isoform X2 n=1 Tax=Acanthaster planci TaxID=133434 RepID=A0A8B7ZPX9_ACAPL|nr:uncharacterized protein LOC110988154 isoform X2 [Acanthaster planci]
MFSGQDAGPPGQWETKQILKWMQGDDECREEIKNRIMNVIRTNDLDGHTLKQLAAEKDEIQDLFPALKDRLAFKSLLRKLFKEGKPVLWAESSTTQKQPPLSQLNTSPSSSHRGHQFTAGPPHFPDVNPGPTHFLRKDSFLVNTCTTQRLAVLDVNHRPAENRPGMTMHFSTVTPSEVPSVHKSNEFEPINTTAPIPYEMQQTVHSSKHANTTTPIYCHPTKTGLGSDQPEKHSVSQTTTLTPVTLSAIPSLCQPANQTDLLVSNATQPSPGPQISSVTSYAVRDKTTKNLLSIHNPSTNRTPHDLTVQTASTDPLASMLTHHARSINYPAPLPRFPFDLDKTLRSCAGGVAMSFTFNKRLSQSIRNLRRRLKQTNDKSMYDYLDSMEGPLPVQVIALDDGEDSEDGKGVDDVIEDEGGYGEGEIILIKDETQA